MKRPTTPPRAFLSRMEACANTAGKAGFRTLYYTGTEKGAPWSESREDAKEMSIAEADQLGPKVSGVRCLVDDGESVAAAVEEEYRERLARQGLD